MADLIGQRLGHYPILSLRGEGGLPAVYRARQLTMKRDVATRATRPGLLDSARMSGVVRRFERAADRVWSAPGDTSFALGFRCARSIPQRIV